LLVLFLFIGDLLNNYLLSKQQLNHASKNFFIGPATVLFNLALWSPFAISKILPILPILRSVRVFAVISCCPTHPTEKSERKKFRRCRKLSSTTEQPLLVLMYCNLHFNYSENILCCFLSLKYITSYFLGGAPMKQTFLILFVCSAFILYGNLL
jgi:hypothetical protein